ncbi:MAG: pectin methylesterase [Clostridia bacterium]|nr:pectin methylesterase [Clostridia bacterium]
MNEIQVFPGEDALSRAIAALPKDDEPITLRLAPGVYREKVVLQRPHTTLEGSGAGESIITWDDGAKEVLPDGMNRGTFRTATLLVDAPHVTLRHLTVENAAAPRQQVGQAIALYVDGDYFTCEECTLRSHQDTLFTAPLPPKELQKNGFIGPKQFAPRTPQRHTYRRCRIEGDVDFIFGGAAAWFEDCDIVSVDAGYATAASTPEGQKYGYVFKHCRFLGDNLPQASCYLGRPWRDYAKTVLLDCTIGAHIRPEGWHDWDKPPFHECGYYAEYPAPAHERVAFAHVLTEEEAARFTYEDFMESM